MKKLHGFEIQELRFAAGFRISFSIPVISTKFLMTFGSSEMEWKLLFNPETPETGSCEAGYFVPDDGKPHGTQTRKEFYHEIYKSPVYKLLG